MSILINGGEKYIIDRTLIVITRKEFDINELESFYFNLKMLGVDFFEVDEKCLNLIKNRLPSDNFIFRIEKIQHLEICYKNNIQDIIIDEAVIETFEKLDIKVKEYFNIIAEININKISKDYTKEISKYIQNNNINQVRLRGIDDFIIEDLENEFKNFKLNIYSYDNLFMATSIGFQAALSGFSSVTTVFCGIDSAYGTSALEEVLLALKVIEGVEISNKINLLSSMRIQYEKLTYKQIPRNKPVVGRDIFKYESGIHVAGIEKSPITYEPYNPELVGLNRNMVLGKHSSKNSVFLKLKEIGKENIFSDFEISIILSEVKRIGLLKKSEVSHNEFIDICLRIEGSRNV